MFSYSKTRTFKLTTLRAAWPSKVFSPERSKEEISELEASKEQGPAESLEIHGGFSISFC